MFLTAWVALSVLPTVAVAADELAAELIPLGLRARTEAPIPLEVRFKWTGTHIIEGRLEMAFHESGRVLGRFRSGEIALTTGEQKFRLLLPTLHAPFSDSQVQVEMKFVTAGRAISLGPSSLFMPTVAERSLVVAWCSARVDGDPQIPGLQASLLFEQFAPREGENLRRELSTSFAPFAVEELPAQPLAYTCFDLVVLTAEAFRGARERQLQALARWVKGGGSLCVFVGDVLQPHHITFLNELAKPAASPAFLADKDGILLPRLNRLSRLRSGLGRSVIVTGNLTPEPGLNSPEWREAVAFLWKFRGSHLRTIAEAGRWSTGDSTTSNSLLALGSFPPTRSRYSPRPDLMVLGQRFAVQPTELGPELLMQLMPRTVRLIPFSAIIGILVLFVLMIGPVDYYLLGFLRRRKFTWLLFPATSVVFTVVTVLMANHYLGQRDQRRSLVVVDLDSDGSALRWNRYELVFAARDKRLVTELRDALWSPLDFPVLQGFSPGYGPMERSGEGRAPFYDGFLPGHFQVVESVRQWRPEFSRTFSFDTPPVPLPPNWRAVENASPDLRQVRRALSEDQSFQGDLYVITADGAVAPDERSGGIIEASILQQLSATKSSGLFELVSQISPTGGGNFEDAGGMEAGNNDSVLAIATRVGEDVVVYRRFFHGN